MQVSMPVMVRVPLMEGACKAVPNTVKLESSLLTKRVGKKKRGKEKREKKKKS